MLLLSLVRLLASIYQGELTCSPDCTWPRFARRGADCDYPAVCDDAAKVNLPLLGVIPCWGTPGGNLLKCLARHWMKEMCCQFNYLLVCVCVLQYIWNSMKVVSTLSLATKVDAVFVTSMLGVESAKETHQWKRSGRLKSNEMVLRFQKIHLISLGNDWD